MKINTADWKRPEWVGGQVYLSIVHLCVTYIPHSHRGTNLTVHDFITMKYNENCFTEKEKQSELVSTASVCILISSQRKGARNTT